MGYSPQGCKRVGWGTSPSSLQLLCLAIIYSQPALPTALQLSGSVWTLCSASDSDVRDVSGQPPPVNWIRAWLELSSQGDSN